MVGCTLEAILHIELRATTEATPMTTLIRSLTLLFSFLATTLAEPRAQCGCPPLDSHDWFVSATPGGPPGAIPQVLVFAVHDGGVTMSVHGPTGVATINLDEVRDGVYEGEQGIIRIRVRCAMVGETCHWGIQVWVSGQYLGTNWLV